MKEDVAPVRRGHVLASMEPDADEVEREARRPLFAHRPQMRRSMGRSSDPLAFACRLLPCVNKLGHQYVLLTRADGRPLVTFGPHWSGTLFAQAVIVGVVWGFTKQHTPIGKSAVASAGMMFFGLLTTVLLWITAGSDPGILRKHAALRDDEDAAEDDVYCDICDMWGPPGTKHCRECGVCILKHDHHCVWMGKCVGQGNMRSFIYFNMAWVSAFMYLFLCLGLLASRAKARGT
uniref:Palmitoyltransferase n=1 Tax=Pinguiococcus pyrenoidosus TaxID=172671 RepID=A0A7R9Y9J1_9STRA